MTTRQLLTSLTASTAALALAGTMAVRSFPLEAQGTIAQAQESTGAPIQIVKGGEHLLHASFAEYPRRAIEQRIEGDVVLDVTTDDRGEVSDARVVSGPDELRRTALESVLQWHYSPEALRSTTLQATLRFTLPTANAEYENRGYSFRMKTEDEQKADLSPAQRAERAMEELNKAMQDPNASDQQKEEWKLDFVKQAMLLEKIRAEGAVKPNIRIELADEGRSPFEGSLRLVRIGGERVTAETMKEFVRRAGVSIGDSITEDMAKRMSEVARNLDEHLRVSFQRDGTGGLIVMLLNP
jgi:TonB family protein